MSLTWQPTDREQELEESDDLAPARGIINAFLISLPIWAAIGTVVHFWGRW